MLLPHEILCEKCGNESRVLTTAIDDRELAGEMAEDDIRLKEGFEVRIECPACGVRQQYIAPPP
jgi:hypothetical protein